MIIHTMTEEQIRKEIFKDSINVHKVINDFTKSFVKSCKNRLPRMFPVLKFYTCKTKLGNDIMILLDAPDYKSRNKPMYGVYFFTKTSNGSVRVYQPLAYYDITTDINVFTSHFISRYNTRLGLNLTNVYDIVQYFISQTTGFIGEVDSNGAFYGTIKSGMVFGYRKDGFQYHTTFVNNEMLFNDQSEYVGEIRKMGSFFDDIRDSREAVAKYYDKKFAIPERISQILQPK